MAEAKFSVKGFLEDPSEDPSLNECRKDDLLLAAHFGVSVARSRKKQEIKTAVLEKLFAVEVLRHVEFPDSGSTGLPGPAEVVEYTAGEVSAGGETEVTPATPGLSLFRPFSLHSPSVISVVSKSARLKVRLARIQVEAREKEQAREHDFRLAMRKLEVDADKEVRLRQVELEAGKSAGLMSRKPDQTTTSGDSNMSYTCSKVGFDITKAIPVLPPFREFEVDAYFSAFERITRSLGWPREIWALLLQCKLTGKAQKVCAALSMEEGSEYEKVKEAILQAYELVPEAYRQRFREYQKAPTQSYVDLAREKSVLFDKWINACKVIDFSALRDLVLQTV